ncbi:MAG: hypothetical protein QOE33_4 [Acidobacteriota bacterium]|nr:hypothetical protein [Acidobacteriota bacterium]
MMPTNTKQPLTHWTRVGLTLAGASLAVMIASASVVYFLSGRKSAFASRQEWAGLATLATILGCFAIAGLITGVTIIFAKRWEAKVVANLRAGQGVLAHWTYTADEWQHYAAREQARARKLFIIIACVMTVVLLVPFTQLMLSSRGGFDRTILEAMLVVSVPIAFVFAILWVVTVMPTRRLSREAPGEAYISADGALIHDRYYPWTYMMQSLRSVRLEEGDPSVVEFTWTQPGYRTSQYHSVRIPVPHGREDEARKLIAKFNSSLI